MHYCLPLSKTRRHAGLAVALVLAGGLAALAPPAAPAATAHFADTFDLPLPPATYGTVFNGEHVPNGTIDTALGTADRSFGLQLDNGDTSPYHPSYSCVGTDCPAAGDTAWHLYFDSADQPGAFVDMWYDFGNTPADFTGGGKMALDFASYDTLSSTASGQVTFIAPGGTAATVPFDLPSGVLQSTPTRLLIDYSGLPVDLSNISLMIVGFHFVGAGGTFTMDRISTVPVPAALPLFVSALAALGGLARRRRSAIENV